MNDGDFFENWRIEEEKRILREASLRNHPVASAIPSLVHAAPAAAPPPARRMPVASSGHVARNDDDISMDDFMNEDDVPLDLDDSNQSVSGRNREGVAIVIRRASESSVRESSSSSRREDPAAIPPLHAAPAAAGFEDDDIPMDEDAEDDEMPPPPNVAQPRVEIDEENDDEEGGANPDYNPDDRDVGFEERHQIAQLLPCALKIWKKREGEAILTALGMPFISLHPFQV